MDACGSLPRTKASSGNEGPSGDRLSRSAPFIRSCRSAEDIRRRRRRDLHRCGKCFGSVRIAVAIHRVLARQLAADSSGERLRKSVDRHKAFQQAPHLLQGDHVRAIRRRIVGILVRFDEDAGDPDGDCGPRQRFHEPPIAARRTTLPARLLDRVRRVEITGAPISAICGRDRMSETSVLYRTTPPAP